MKTIRSTSKSGSFLLELIIAVLIFSIAGAVCVQMFVKAHLISRKSEDMGAAMLFAQSFAEQYKSMDTETLGDLLAEDSLVLYCGYDVQGNYQMDLQPGEGTRYLLTGTHDSSREPLLGMEIRVYPYRGEMPAKGEQVLYALSVKRYVRDFAGMPPSKSMELTVVG